MNIELPLEKYAQKQYFVVLTNSDGTEGKGRTYPLAITTILSTAIRLSKGKYVQGTDCPIEEITAFLIDDKWYFPFVAVNIVLPTKEDLQKDEELKAEKEKKEKYEKTLLKIQQLGVSQEDLDIIRSFNRSCN